MRATLEGVLTEPAFERMIALAGDLRRSIAHTIDTRRLPWNVVQLGCRVEYGFSPSPPRNGTTAKAAADRDLEAYLHLHLLNRGVLITPFHNMVLMSPSTTAADVAAHDRNFTAAVDELLGAD